MVKGNPATSILAHLANGNSLKAISYDEPKKVIKDLDEAKRSHSMWIINARAESEEMKEADFCIPADIVAIAQIGEFKKTFIAPATDKDITKITGKTHS